MIYTMKNTICWKLLSVEFEKAFDSVNWIFLCLVAKFGHMFELSPRYGHISQWFRLKRGVNKGSPCSVYLFILFAETLSGMYGENAAKQVYLQMNVKEWKHKCPQYHMFCEE